MELSGIAKISILKIRAIDSSLPLLLFLCLNKYLIITKAKSSSSVINLSDVPDLSELFNTENSKVMLISTHTTHQIINICNRYYRSGTVNSKSFISKVLLRIKWKFKLYLCPVI